MKDAGSDEHGGVQNTLSLRTFRSGFEDAVRIGDQIEVALAPNLELRIELGGARITRYSYAISFRTIKPLAAAVLLMLWALTSCKKQEPPAQPQKFVVKPGVHGDQAMASELALKLELPGGASVELSASGQVKLAAELLKALQPRGNRDVEF